MQEKKSKSARDIIKLMISYIKPHGFWFFLRVITAIVIAGYEIVRIYILLNLVDATLAGNMPEVMRSIYLMLVTVAVGILASILKVYSAGRFGAKVTRDIKEWLACHVGKLPVSYVENHHSGEIVSRVVQDVTVFEAFLKGGLTDSLFHLIKFTGCFIYMIFLNWQLLLFCIVVIVTFVLLSNIINRPMKKYANQLYTNLAKVNTIVQDSIGGIHMLKAFNLRKALSEKFEAKVNNALSDNLAIIKRNAMLTPFRILIEILPTMLCFLLGGYMVIAGNFTVGGLVAAINIMNHLSNSGGTFPSYISDYKRNFGTATHFFEVLDYKPERSGGKAYSVKTDVPAVEFAGVSFAYENQIKVLDRLCFEIPYGKTSALVGASGSGKSTLFKLLCGFYTPQEGRIELFGENLEQWDLRAARSLISLVSQETYLFPTTIAENIAYGRPGASMDEIVAAARSAHASDFIEELPDKYNSLTGERGIRLSGGQKQRIAIARAILKDAPVLLLDEPTSALDTQSELLVQQVLERFMENRTVLMIAHRLSTTKNAHKVIVLDQGKIVESGSHAELMEKDGVFKMLYRKQFSLQENGTTTAGSEEGGSRYV